MKKNIMIVALVFVALLALLGVLKPKLAGRHDNNQTTDVAYVGPANAKLAIDTSMSNAKNHYDLIRAARALEEQGNYDLAIQKLKEAIPSAKFRFEVGAIHLTLAEIYKKTNDSKNEKLSRELVAEYTGNDDLKKESLARAEELQKIINIK